LTEDEAHLLATRQGGGQPTPLACAACKGQHTLHKKMALGERRRIVDEARACSSCLQVGHFARVCQNRRKCPVEKCLRKHHPLLHDKELMKLLYFENYKEECPLPATPQ